MEIGPFRLVPNGDGKLVEAEGAWNEYANVIFSMLLSSALSTREGPCRAAAYN